MEQVVQLIKAMEQVVKIMKTMEQVVKIIKTMEQELMKQIIVLNKQVMIMIKQ